MKAVVCVLLLLAAAGPGLAIGPRPETGSVLGTEPAAFRPDRRYFSQRPPIIDIPQIPPTTSPSGSCRALVLLVDFDDKEADRVNSTPAFFSNKLFADHQTSMRAYFQEISYGRLLLEGDVYGWFRCPCKHRDLVNRDGISGTQDDHGLDISPGAVQPSICDFPLNIWGLVAQAVSLADETVDFSLYDSDGPDGLPSSGDDDGMVDALFVIHSGPGAETLGGLPVAVNFMWSMQSNLDYYIPTRGTTADDTRIDAFVLVPEDGEIGVFAHEFCHLLGLPDLYDTETGLPVVGEFCLMDEGAWNGPAERRGSIPAHLSAPMKYILGWIEPRKVCLGCDGQESIENARLAPWGVAPSSIQVLANPGGMDWSAAGGGSGEYFLLENRQSRQGYFESFLPASGMVIWRVDESRPNNNDLERTLATIVQADGQVVDREAPGMNIPGDASDVWPGSLDNRNFTPRSTPPSTLSRDRFSGAAVENVTQEASGQVTADVSVGFPKKGVAYAYPNPYKLTESSPLRIVYLPDPGPDAPIRFEVKIFDMEGNLVRRLEAPQELVGNGTALWDAKDESGNLIGPGLYLYVVESSGQRATGVIGISK